MYMHRANELRSAVRNVHTAVVNVHSAVVNVRSALRNIKRIRYKANNDMAIVKTYI